METAERTRVLEFLKRHVIGKYLVADPITTLGQDDSITSAYEEDAVFSNLVETAQGFSFDMITLARGTRYLHGDTLLAEGSLNAVRVVRYEMTERLSTGDLLGHARFVASTNTHPDPFAGTIFLVRMWLNDTTLEVEENHVGYADVVSAEGTYKPIATSGTYTYTVENDRLVVKYQQQTYDVDPKTLERTQTAEKAPVQVSREIVFPQPLDAGSNQQESHTAS